jgi:hypothetical protein
MLAVSITPIQEDMRHDGHSGEYAQFDDSLRVADSIGCASQLLKAGEHGAIGEGIYREFVRPACGGLRGSRLVHGNMTGGENHGARTRFTQSQPA